MENKMNKFGLRKLLAVWVVAFACVCMWGCSDTEFRWNDVRSGAKIVGFVNDSLVMVGDYRCWTEITDGVGANYKDIDGCGQERLCVYNYRVQENGPRWCDSISNRNSTGIFGMEVHSSRPSGQMTDSIIWGGYVNNSIRLWKIGELPHEISLNKKMDGCSVEFTVQSVKQWFDGTFIAKSDRSLSAGDDNCQYAVLDTIARTLTYKRLGQDLEWIKKCDDVRAWENDVYCLVLDRMTYDAYLVVNETIKYSMMRDMFKLGNYAVVSFLGDYISLHRTLYKYENNEVCRMTGYSEFGISFGDGNGNYIVYDN